MPKCKILSLFFLLFIYCGSLVPFLMAQEIPKTPDQTPKNKEDVTNDDVIKIDTNLIQTGFTVFDQVGKKVDSLKQDDFELKVDSNSNEK